MQPCIIRVRSVQADAQARQPSAAAAPSDNDGAPTAEVSSLVCSRIVRAMCFKQFGRSMPGVGLTNPKGQAMVAHTAAVHVTIRRVDEHPSLRMHWRGIGSYSSGCGLGLRR